MDILIDTRHIQNHPTGVGRYTLELLAAMEPISQDHHIQTFSIHSKTPVIPSSLTHLHKKYPSRLSQLELLSRNTSFETIVDTKAEHLFFPNLSITPKKIDIPYTLTVHDLSFKIFPEFYSKKMRAWHTLTRAKALIENAHSIITPSLSTKRDLLHFYKVDESRIHIIPHGIHPSFRPEPQDQDESIRSKYNLPNRFVLNIGTLEPRKNISALLHALEQYRIKYNDPIQLIMAGSFGWKSENVKKQIQSLSWVHHKTFIDQDDLPSFYRLAEAFLWPSIYEGFGMPVLEAMASGTPTLTSHTSSLPEITGGNALLIDPYNESDILEGIHSILQEKDLQKDLKNKGIMQAKSYSWTNSARQTLDVLKS